MRQAGFSFCCLNFTHSPSPGNPLLFHAAGLHGLAPKASDSIEAATVVWLLMCLCVYTHVSDLTLWLVVYLQKMLEDTTVLEYVYLQCTCLQ